MKTYTKPSEVYADGYALPGYHMDNTKVCWCFKDERILLPPDAVPMVGVQLGRNMLPIAKIEDIRQKAVQ